MNTALIDLHLHLDGSLYLPWAYRVALRDGIIAKETTFEQYYDMMSFKESNTLQEVFAKFDFPCQVMQTYDNLKESIYYLIELLAHQGLIYAEIRYAPCQHTLQGLTQKQTIQALIDGINQAAIDFPTIKVGLINCLMHKGDNAAFNMDTNMETIEVTREFIGKGVVGMDLAGYENNGEFKDYAPLFEKLGEYQIPYTIHAGEQGFGQHVMDALDMGAYRIGHGINAIENKDYVTRLVDTQIPLEICLTSNVFFTKDYAQHPIRQLLDAGVKVTLNTDNMTFTKTNLANEHNQARAIGISEEVLIQSQYNAVECCFADQQTKLQLKEKLDALLK